MFLKTPFNKSISVGFLSIILTVITFLIHILFKYYIHKSIITDLVSIGLAPEQCH